MITSSIGLLSTMAVSRGPYDGKTTYFHAGGLCGGGVVIGRREEGEIDDIPNGEWTS